MATIFVCLDPGHAKGSDKHGCNGFSEQAHNLLMAKALKEKLESTGKIKVVLTRTNENDDPSLTTRGRTAARNDCDLFLSMHSNGADGTARGVTVFYSVDLPKDKALAARLSKAVSDALGMPNRGAKYRESAKYQGEDYYTVIDAAQDSGTPHVLLSENGFHDNPTDCKLIRPAAGIDKIAEAHAKVICDLYGITYQPVVERKHTVVKGESLSKISKAYGVKWQNVAKLNGIKLPYIIRAGQVLRIPAK